MLFSQDTALEPQLTLGGDEGGERVESGWSTYGQVRQGFTLFKPALHKTSLGTQAHRG